VETEGRKGLREKGEFDCISLFLWSTKREIVDLVSFSLCIILRSELSSTKTNGIVGSFSQLASQVSFFKLNSRVLIFVLALIGSLHHSRPFRFQGSGTSCVLVCVCFFFFNFSVLIVCNVYCL